MDFINIIQIENMDLVSIIIPHYKVDIVFLKECLDSIIAQTYHNLEIIIVDDGNEEDIARQIDVLTLEDKRIQVLHQKNQGVSVARNKALEKASGQWIMFCDPDDWMRLDKVEILLEIAKINKADIVFGRYYKLCNDMDLMKDCNKEFVFKEGAEIEKLIRKLLSINGMLELDGMQFKLAVVWNGIYARHILTDVRFPDKMHPIEDEIFNLYAFSKAKKIIFLGKKLHYYRNNSGIGVMRNFQSNTLHNYQYGEQERIKFIDKQYGKIEKYFNSKEMTLRSLRILIILCKSYFFNSMNPDSYIIRKKKLQKYIHDNMPFFENMKMRTICSNGIQFKYLLFSFLIKVRIYFPLEICWSMLKIQRR